MFKIIGGTIAGVILTAALTFFMAGGLMFNEHENPFGVEETAARIQANIRVLPTAAGPCRPCVIPPRQ